MIGLDYEAFINSSFLRQGQANEFSKKLPKERKDVLANILGLNRYEKAKKLAAEKIRTLNHITYRDGTSMKLINKLSLININKNNIHNLKKTTYFNENI